MKKILTIALVLGGVFINVMASPSKTVGETDMGNVRSRVAIAARVAEERRRPENWNEISEDYDLPFDKAEAQTRAAKWPWQVYII